jgi:hypothetical protein
MYPNDRGKGRPVANTPRQSVAIVDSDYVELMRLVVAFGQMGYSVSASESHAIVRAARDIARTSPAAMVVALAGTENVVEIRELLTAGEGTRFLFLMPDMPPSAALARLMNAHGAATLGKDEPSLLIASTLVALLATGDGPA